MEGVLAIFFIFGGGTAFLLAISPVGKAIADRIRGRGAADIDGEVYQELDDLRAEVAELHERMDFAERLLADKRGQDQLTEGTPVPKGFPHE
ncbi:MAG: hypothetical protein V3T16_10010 [Gemmatimonadales bacterium]